MGLLNSNMHANTRTHLREIVPLGLPYGGLSHPVPQHVSRVHTWTGADAGKQPTTPTRKCWIMESGAHVSSCPGDLSRCRAAAWAQTHVHARHPADDRRVLPRFYLPSRFRYWPSQSGKSWWDDRSSRAHICGRTRISASSGGLRQRSRLASPA